MVKMRHEGRVENRAVYVVVGIDLGWAQGCSWTLDQCQRRGQVLAAGADRNTPSRGEGYLHRVRGRVEGLSTSHRDAVSPNAGTDLHRAPGAGQPELRGLERAQA